MGLDIYKYRLAEPGEESDDFRELIKEDFGGTNKAMNEFFERFKDKTVEVENTFYNVKEWFDNKKLDYRDYVCVETEYGPSGAIGTYAKVDDNKDIDYDNTIKVVFSDLSEYKKSQQAIRVIETDYQRKGMNKDFYTKFLSGCWYISTETELSEDDSKDIIFTKSDFEKAKEFLQSDEGGMAEWDFIEGRDAIYFSY